MAYILWPHRPMRSQWPSAPFLPPSSKELLCGWFGQHKSGSVWVSMSAAGGKKTLQNSLSVANLILFLLGKVAASTRVRRKSASVWNLSHCSQTSPFSRINKLLFNICIQSLLNRIQQVHILCIRKFVEHLNCNYQSNRKSSEVPPAISSFTFIYTLVKNFLYVGLRLFYTRL